jgi:hypothetical protein
MADDLGTRIRRSIERVGLEETARRLALRPIPTSRLAAGAGVKSATEQLARVNLDKLDVEVAGDAQEEAQR